MFEWTERTGTDVADFNNCVYADKALGEVDFKKAQRFAGRLVSAVCRCPEGSILRWWARRFQGIPGGALLGLRQARRKAWLDNKELADQGFAGPSRERGQPKVAAES